MSLIAWYPLNGDTLDYSGNGNHGTGTITYNSSGKTGQTIDTNTGVVTITLNNMIKSVFSGNKMSLCLWWKQYAIPTNWADIIQYTDVVGIQRRLEVGYASANPNYHTLWTNIGKDDTTYNGAVYNSDNFALIGDWIHLAFVRDNNFYYVYKNGIKYATITVTNDIPIINTNLTLATHDNAYSYMNDVRFYNHALSEKEVYELSKAKIVHYKFNDFQEPTTNLFSQTNNLIVSNSTWSDIIYDDNLKEWTITRKPESDRTYFAINNYFQQQLNTVYNLSFEIWADVDGILNYDANDYIYLNGILDSRTSDNDTWRKTCKLTVPNTKNRQWVKVNKTITTKQIGVDTFMSHYNYEDSVPITIESGHTAKCNDSVYSLTATIIKIRNVQFEQKDHATPFIDGSRTGLVTDCSGYEHHIILDSADTPTWVSESKLGSGCYKFNGVNNRMRINSLTISALQDITYSAWVYIDDTFSTTGAIVAGQISTSSAFYINLNKKLYGAQDDSGISSSSTIPINQWSHVVYSFSFDGISTAYQKLYINGVLVQSRTDNAYTDTYTDDMWIGYDDRFYSYFNGMIDDVRIYATALPDQDIKNLYEVRTSLDNKGNLYTNQIKENELLEIGEKVVKGDYYVTGQYGLAIEIKQDITLRKVTIDANFIGQLEVIAIKTAIPGSMEGTFYKSKTFDVILGVQTLELNIDLEKGNYYLTRGADYATKPLRRWSSGITNLTYDSEDITVRGLATNNSYYYFWFDIRYSKRINMDEKGVFKSLYFNEVGPTNGLIGWWKFDGNVLDYSGNNYHGVNNGAVITSGLKGSSYQFNNNNVTVSNITQIPTTAVTAIAWFKRLGLPGSGYHIIFNCNNLGIEISIPDPGDSLRTGVYTSSRIVFNSGSGLIDGNWHQVGLVYDNTKIYAYIDGIMTGTIDVTGTLALTNSIILGQYNNYYTNGCINNVRLYNRALTEKEMSILYNMDSNKSLMKINDDGTLYLSGQIKEV